ncbi:hypothetical protein QAD02_012277 [Eretmocerus hayati]|uniref:Uncharacterized protein n=1 Tax=Eretmocerus hayati TaxID=131215 RepID=A0ACC2NZ61_9HYME|nr:hypothetical protein QAD02_012277 [Eretmocerus hayati]
MRRARGAVFLVACAVLGMGLLALTSRLVFVDEEVVRFEHVPALKIAAQSAHADFREDSDGQALVDNFATSSSTETIRRYVTPSLAELGGRGSTPASNEHVLMVTRVPGAGSELLVFILQRLQGYNAFKHIRLPPGDEGILSTLQQELLVEEVTSIIRQEAIPLSFDGDVRFLNFSAYGRQAPSFISLIRNPLDPKTLERFKKGDSATVYRGSISHFCGHDSRCSQRNNAWALEQAKSNVRRWYPVVGVLDSMEETVESLEKVFPYFFEGAPLVYEKIRPKKMSIPADPTVLKPGSKKRLKKLLKYEIEFYEWVKSRLLNGTLENG